MIQEDFLSEDFIETFTFFKNFTNEEKHLLKKLLKRRKYQNGDLIIKEGDSGKSLYLLVSGKVQVLKQVNSHEVVRIDFVSEQNYFGEFSLVDDEARSASIAAIQETLIYELDYKSYKYELFKTYPGTELKILKGILLDAVRKLRTLSHNRAITQGFLTL